MQFTPGYGSFVARATLTATKARALYAAGHRHVLIQVDYQGSKLRQRTLAQIFAESLTAAAAGLTVGWWMWVRPTPWPTGRLSGLGAMQLRLDFLVTGAHLAGCGLPTTFVLDCEVGGGWSRSRPKFRPFIEAARRMLGPGTRIGLSSHGEVGSAWDVGEADVGMPQIYRRQPVTPDFAMESLTSWSDCKELWPTLGCADEYSDAEEMAADVAALASLGCHGATWWTARQLSGAKLAASVPAGLRGRGEGGSNA